MTKTRTLILTAEIETDLPLGMLNKRGAIAIEVSFRHYLGVRQHRFTVAQPASVPKASRHAATKPAARTPGRRKAGLGSAPGKKS